MSKPLAEKVAVVTGASRGIGRAIALRLGRDGASVAVHYGRNREAADRAVKEIEGAGGTAFSIGVELGTLASVEELFDSLDLELTSRNGSNRFDILVNNAAIAPDASVEDTTEDVFDRVFAVNTKVPFFISQKALPRLRDGGQIGSANVRNPVTGQSRMSSFT